MYINFQQNWVSRLVNTVTVHTNFNLFAKKLQIAPISNLQFKFKKKLLEITPFGHALPLNGHSGQI